jgi:hypothetical protein
MAKIDGRATYESLKQKKAYSEEVHCPMILEVMSDPNKATVAAFCVQAGIGDSTFYRWLKAYPMFEECYAYGKMQARYNWEREGELLGDLEFKEVGCKYELWRLKGWSQFGIGKNSRIRVDLKQGGTPAEHYHDLLRHANSGDFTAGEIKQLMEAINVGLNAHQAFEMQAQLDALKKDLEKMESRTGG